MERFEVGGSVLFCLSVVCKDVGWFLVWSGCWRWECSFMVLCGSGVFFVLVVASGGRG